MSSKDAKNNPVFKHNAPTGNWKRPSHKDFMTTEEHRKNRTTGIRKNENVLEWEFWILGEIVKRVHFSEVAKDPKALEKAHFEVFAMGPPNGVFE